MTLTFISKVMFKWCHDDNYHMYAMYQEATTCMIGVLEGYLCFVDHWIDRYINIWLNCMVIVWLWPVNDWKLPLCFRTCNRKINAIYWYIVINLWCVTEAIYVLTLMDSIAAVFLLYTRPFTQPINLWGIYFCHWGIRQSCQNLGWQCLLS